MLELVQLFGLPRIVYIHECYIASREIREDRLLRLRINLVQDRTRVMNRVHSLLDKYDVKCDYDKILMSMTGIDYFSAMMIASEIGDITRFSTPEKLVSWSGLCPSIHQSGNSLYMGRMKYGNKKVRWILSQVS
jgi:transposase